VALGAARACEDYDLYLDLYLRIARDFPIGCHDEVVAEYRKHGANMTKEQMMDTPSIKQELKDLILKSLNLDYIAKSCLDNTETGNHYQSLVLGQTQTTGFRTERGEFLDEIDFEGKKVLDLGSNLGEISRAARDRGAYLVDGFEYDPFFLELAQLVNSHNDVTRVSFYQHDITDPSLYKERYDIVLAFSVFIYIQNVLDRIADITNQALVLETHRLDGNLESTYLGSVLQYFPHHRILGETEWGTTVDPGVKRALIVFAKQKSALTAVLKTLQAKVDPATRGIVAAEGAKQSDSKPTFQYIDVIRSTSWYDCFFSTLQFDFAEELLEAVAEMQVDVDTMVKSRDLRRKVMSGWVYWWLYIKGYLQYVDTSQVDKGNVYYDYLMKYFGPEGHDPGLHNVLAAPHTTAERAIRRFQDFELFRNHAAYEPNVPDSISPITLIVRDLPTSDAKFVYEVGSDTPLQASIDGYHRLFLARLFDIEALPYEIVHELPQSKSKLNS
jgi:2-polyprenyl-3-methyl-5-hydroxy-6-metoxy-1,4-benzoquinol methylase